jgi:hypothetical protein
MKRFLLLLLTVFPWMPAAVSAQETGDDTSSKTGDDTSSKTGDATPVKAPAAAPEEEKADGWEKSFEMNFASAYVWRGLNLLGQGWDWRKAAYIAWAATPKDKRWPENQDELAREVLGLTSDRVVAKWKSNNPAIEQAVAALQTYELFSYRGEVLSALKQSAATPDYKHHQDRKLFLEMIGDYIPQAQLRQLLMSGKMRLNKAPEDYSEEELQRFANATGMTPEEIKMFCFDMGEDDFEANSTLGMNDDDGSADE